MRAREFILEYERQRAAQALGDGLWLAMLAELLGVQGHSPADIRYEAENDPRGKIVLTSPEQQKKLADNALEMIEAVDPSTNKKYTQWMARQFMTSEPHMEDVTSTLADYVTKFHKLNTRKKLPPGENDINRYKTAKQLYLIMDRYEDPVDDTADKGTAEKLYEDGDVTIIIPKDEAAACRYGRQTKWCTAAVHGSNYFDSYNKQGPLYILIPKQPKHDGEKYQLHFATAQYMDEDDDPVDVGKLLKERFPGAGNMFMENESTAKILRDTVAFTPDGVIEGVVQQIWEYVQDRVNDVLTDWEGNDDYYYKWLQEQGYVDAEGEIDWDRAPNYLEFNDEARRWSRDIEEFVNLSPKYLRITVADQVGDGTFDEDSVYQIDSYLAENLRREMRRENDGGIADWIDKNIHIRKGTYGPVVELIRRGKR